MELDHPSATALTDALIDDPFYRAITIEFQADANARFSVLRQYFAFSLLDAAQNNALTLADDPRKGAAIWQFPTNDNRGKNTREKLTFLSTILGAAGFNNYQAMIKNMAPLAQQLTTPGAWYLSIIGVAPDSHGSGIGQRLLSGTLARAKAERKECYLETYSPQTHGFYSRLGFIAIGSTVEPVTGCNYTLMRFSPPAD